MKALIAILIVVVIVGIVMWVVKGRGPRTPE